LKTLNDTVFEWIDLAASLDAVERCRQFVDGKTAVQAFPQSRRFKLELALEEVLVNVVHYAYSEDQQEGWIKLGYYDDDGTVCIRIVDGGRPFDPLLKEDPDISMNIEDREVGGLGIFLVKNMVDDLSYQRSDNRNISTFCISAGGENT
jgi:anti-sigma regulatory factor (Ser/Thr protein kinase)